MLTLGVSLTWCVAMFKRADDEVVLDESEITRVRARDLLQRLDLTDVTGTRRIVVAYQMENFGRLRQLIRERTARPAAGPSQRVFARSPGSILLSLHWPLIVVMVCVWAWRQDAPRAVYGVLWGVAWGLWSILVPPGRVRLLDDAVAVDSLGWSRKIPYANIVATRLEDLKNVRDKETTGGVATVLIETTRGRTIKLAGFKDGSLALFGALEEAWKRGGPPR